MTFLFLSLVLILFPLLGYFLYIIYSKSSLKEENEIFFDFSLATSLYLFVRLGTINKYTIIFIGIPLFLSFSNKRSLMVILLGLLTFYIKCDYFKVSIIIYFISYLISLIIYFFIKLRAEDKFILTEVIWFIIVLVFESSIKLSFIYILFYLILLYVICKLIIYFENKIKDMLSVYKSLYEVKKEQKFYESLFKVTHEIKNPLAVCKGYLDMMDTNDVKKTSRYVGIINQELDRTLELLKDFSNISKSININRESMDIMMLLNDVCDEMKFIFNNDIKFNYRLSDDEYYILGDYNRLKQVLINIIKNAKESIYKKGNISLTYKKDNSNIIIAIKDDGCGIESDVLDKIGTPFFTTKKNGTGLGVCFSKEIIEKHNGTINYYSKKSSGTNVVIKLPLIKAS